MIKGSLLFDGLALYELTLQAGRRGEPLSLKASAAFVDSKKGRTHGTTTAQGPWSPALIEKAKEFLAAVEAEVARQHMQDLGGDEEDLVGIGETLRDDAGIPQR